MAHDKTATPYHMVRPAETCPFGVHAREPILRTREGVEVTGGGDRLQRSLDA
ncbi:MAG: hypothetical protein ABW184_08520 [Sphingobium sp.]